MPHTAYSTAKFAVKGFTEALITDLRVHAPHVKAAVVMPGHIGTSIAINSRILHGRSLEVSADETAQARTRMARRGISTEGLTDEQVRDAVRQQLEDFRDKAPVTAAQAASIILDGVRREQWRILVGEDAKRLDRLVRGAPENAYEMSFALRLQAESGA